MKISLNDSDSVIIKKVLIDRSRNLNPNYPLYNKLNDLNKSLFDSDLKPIEKQNSIIIDIIKTINKSISEVLK